MKQATTRLLDKSQRSIRAAEQLLASHDAEFAASRAYYAMFYIAEALLNEKDLRFKKHGGVHGAFGESFVKTGIFEDKFHRWLLEAFDLRITSDYGVDALITDEDVAKLLDHARQFLDAARRYLAAS